MEDSSNGKVEETREVEPENDQPRKDVVVEDVGDSSKPVEVESVKVLEIKDENSNSEPTGKRVVFVIDEIIESAEKLPDGDDSSSSSSSSDEEEQPEKPDEETHDQQVEKKEDIGHGSSRVENVEKTSSSSAENDVVADLVSKGVEETTKLQSSYENNDSPDEAATTELGNLIFTVGAFKGINSPGESSSQAVYEAASGNVDNPAEIPETTEKSPVVSVTRDSLQLTSWKSCCGLFEVLRQSDR